MNQVSKGYRSNDPSYPKMVDCLENNNCVNPECKEQDGYCFCVGYCQKDDMNMSWDCSKNIVGPGYLPSCPSGDKAVPIKFANGNLKMTGQSCFENTEVLAAGADLLKLIQDCTVKKDWPSCLADIKTLQCTDIDNLIRLYVGVTKAKKDGTYEKTRNEILMVFQKLKIMQIKDFVKKILDPLISSLDKFNCLIDSINKDFELDKTEKLELLDLKEIRSDLAMVMNKKMSIENYVRDTNPCPPCPQSSNTYMIVSIITMSIMFLIICFLLFKLKIIF